MSTTLSHTTTAKKLRKYDKLRKQRTKFFDNLKPTPFTERAVREFNRRQRGQEAVYPVPLNEDDDEHPMYDNLGNVFAKLRRAGGPNGPDLNCLRGYDRSAPNKPSILTRTWARGDLSFERHLEQSGIYIHGGGALPSNFAAIQTRMRAPRVEPIASRPNIPLVLKRHAYFSSIFPYLTGDTTSTTSPPQHMRNLLRLTSPNVSAPQIAHFDASPESSLDPRLAKKLERSIKPIKASPLILPNFFTEAVDSILDDVRAMHRRASFAAAHGARGVWAVGDACAATTNPTPTATDGGDGIQAHTIVFTISRTHARAYTVHADVDAAGAMYWVNELGSWALDEQGQWEAMVGAWRNLRKWTKEQRERVIGEANTWAVREWGVVEAGGEDVEAGGENGEKEAADGEEEAADGEEEQEETGQPKKRKLPQHQEGEGDEDVEPPRVRRRLDRNDRI